MKKSLVGYTGFVGSNILAKEEFDGLYDSKNIKDAYGTEPEILYYSGVPAQKFMANKFPEKDFETIQNAINNIKEIKPKKIVLISTIDIYNNPNEVNEESEVIIDKLQTYGKNRYYLENWVKNNFTNYLILHLPGLYGKNIKKNFIYDLINIIPSMLTEEKFLELEKKDNFIKKYYYPQENGYYKCRELTQEDKEPLKEYFTKIGFSALNFTDSRGIYQFYNLGYLTKHISVALKNNLKTLNLAVEPVTISELYKYIYEKNFKNELIGNIPEYNFKTKYDYLFGGKNGYIFDKEFILKDIKKFVQKMQ